MKQETVLPKNIRQIGEIQQDKKIYLEDYVVTFIHKAEKETQKKGCAGLLMGRKEETEDGYRLFITGALLQDETAFLQETPQQRKETEQLKDVVQKTAAEQETGSEQVKASLPEKEKASFFANLQPLGYFVIGTMEEERIEAVLERLQSGPQLIFHLQEGEETLYWSEAQDCQRIRGYFIFYERNPEMQKYMTEFGPQKQVEQEEGNSDKAILSFRKKISDKTEKKRSNGLRYLAGSFLILVVLVLGVTILNSYDKMKDIEAVIQQLSVEQEVGEDSQSQLFSGVENQQQTMQGVPTENQSVLQQSGSAEGQQGDANSSQLEDSLTDMNSGQSEDLQADTNNGQPEDQQTGMVTTQEPQAEQSVETVATQGSQAEGEADTADGTQENMNIEANANTEQTEAVMSGNAIVKENTSPESLTSSFTSQNGTASQNTLDEVQDAVALEDQIQAERNYSAENLDHVAEEIENFGKTDEITASAQRQQQAAYTIKYGDTLADISEKYYGSLEKVEEICRLNHIEDANLIVPGQKIVLP